MADEKRMPASQLRQKLARSAKAMRENRDESRAEAEANKDNDFLNGFYRGRAQGFELALHSLHIWTNGEFGEHLPGGEEQ